MRLLPLLVVLLSPPGVPVPSEDFEMIVRDAFTITGRGLVVTGIVEGGPVSVDDVVCLRPADGPSREVRVAGIEQFRRMIEVAAPGMAVGLLFEELERDDVAEGDRLTADCE